LQAAQSLSERCVSGSASILNHAMLQESRKAINQSIKIERLTLLAFFFAPLGFLTSFFGMNFSQFGQGTLSVWIFFTAMVPVLMLSATVLFWRRLLSLLFSKHRRQT